MLIFKSGSKLFRIFRVLVVNVSVYIDCTEFGIVFIKFGIVFIGTVIVTSGVAV